MIEISVQTVVIFCMSRLHRDGFASRNEKLWHIVRYEHCDRKEKQFCMRYYQMVTHPSTNPIRRSLTPGTRLLDRRSVHRFTNLSVRQGFIPWKGRQCNPFMTHISSSVLKNNNSPTPSILRIVSKADTATREYRKKCTLTKYVQRRLMHPLGTYF